MKNYRLLTEFEREDDFIKEAVEFIKKHVKKKKVFCALSGGIDSSATYLLLKRAKVDVLPVFIDHGLMRIIRGKDESFHVKKFFPKVKIVDIKDEFLPKIYGEGDAEEKRKLFKKAYAETFSKIIKEENCEILADGTILPDLEESFGVTMDDLKEEMTFEEEVKLREKQKGEGFVKSQHNVEIKYDVEATVQPCASLTKDQVRNILAFFGMPNDLVYRKAFPGPALATRIVGPITKENLAFQKRVHDLIEYLIDDYYTNTHGRPMIINDYQQQEPFQSFAALFKDVDKAKVTGIIDGQRTYMAPKLVSGEYNFSKLVNEASELTEYSRLFYLLAEHETGDYDVVIRSVNSTDARTATVTNLPQELLNTLKDVLLSISGIRRIFYDMTPKPPATIEYV